MQSRLSCTAVDYRPDRVSAAWHYKLLYSTMAPAYEHRKQTATFDKRFACWIETPRMAKNSPCAGLVSATNQASTERIKQK